MRSGRASGMSHVPRLVGAGVAVVVLAGGLVACGGDDEPEVAPSPTASASSSAAGTPSPSEPPRVQLPAEAKKRTDEGMIAFVGYWYDVFNEAVDRLDTTRLRAISSSACDLCSSFADHIDEVADGGGWIEMEPWSVNQAQILKSANESRRPSMGLYVVTKDEKYKLTPDSPTRTTQGSQRLAGVTLEWRSGQWVMYAQGEA